LGQITAVTAVLSAPSVALAQTGGFAAIFSDPITVAFIVVNVLLTFYFAYMRFDRFAVAHGPEVLTTVGITGCFLGIAVALLHFDAANVSASVPHLLEGVKTAFWASVSGVAGSLVIRGRHRFQKEPIAMPEGAAKAASLDDVVNGLTALQRSLSGNEEGTLLTQLKLMRQEQTDELGKLRRSFDTFAEKMAEDGSKALIDALREVIADFNAQINEQFGENFKQLNAAVEHLVTWQRQYKDELHHMQEVQAGAAADLKSSAGSLKLMAERANAFTEAAADLERILTGLAQQYVIIERSQQSLVTVLAEMKDVAPQFAKKLDELADSMNAGVSKVQSSVADVVRNFGVQHQSSAAELKQLLTETVRKSQSEVNDQMAKGLDAVRQSVVALDKGLQEELNKSLETLGRQLASLSEKFVADYGPLTDRLREVVRLAASTNRMQ
jgi:DNA-binding XRE family transcriptional regulator